MSAQVDDEIARLRAEVERLKAELEGVTASHEDEEAAHAETLERMQSAESRLAAIRERAKDSNRLLRLALDKTTMQGIRAAVDWALEGDAPQGAVDSLVAEYSHGDNIHGPDERRYPCSPTCTHDDAATPGHPERVRERSEAIVELIGESIEVDLQEASRQRAYESGAEAMRSACLAAVRQRLQVDGSMDVYEIVKAAIEGAIP